MHIVADDFQYQWGDPWAWDATFARGGTIILPDHSHEGPRKANPTRLQSTWLWASSCKEAVKHCAYAIYTAFHASRMLLCTFCSKEKK